MSKRVTFIVPDDQYVGVIKMIFDAGIATSVEVLPGPGEITEPMRVLGQTDSKGKARKPSPAVLSALKRSAITVDGIARIGREDLAQAFIEANLNPSGISAAMSTGRKLGWFDEDDGITKRGAKALGFQFAPAGTVAQAGGNTGWGKPEGTARDGLKELIDSGVNG